MIAKGGEGEVFHVSGQPNLVIKIYTDNKHLERREKIATMISRKMHQVSELVAFPKDTLHTPEGVFVGFLMRKAAGVPIHELYAARSRLSHFPQADFRFVARAATNLARAVAAVHNAGCVIGDINESGFLVGANATINVIDADSFQVVADERIYRCLVGKAEYTPPELQGSRFDSVERTISHDHFGLAVLIFQILFLGRHPYSGQYSVDESIPIKRAISEGLFAFGAHPEAKPLPSVPTFLDIPANLAVAFERAFSPNPADFTVRPDAVEWAEILEKFEGGLLRCRSNPGHYYANRKSGCPWCRVELQTGSVLFPIVNLTISAPPKNRRIFRPKFVLSGMLILALVAAFVGWNKDIRADSVAVSPIGVARQGEDVTTGNTGPKDNLNGRVKSSSSNVIKAVGPPSREELAEIQLKLKVSGYEAGAIDGIMGKRTMDAIARFASSKGIDPGDLQLVLFNLRNLALSRKSDIPNAEATTVYLSARRQSLLTIEQSMQLQMGLLKVLNKKEIEKVEVGDTVLVVEDAIDSGSQVCKFVSIRKKNSQKAKDLSKFCLNQDTVWLEQ